MRKIALWAIMMFLFTVLAACEKAPTRAKDPLEVISENYFQLCKTDKWDEAYAMLSADSLKYYPKETFIEDQKMYIKPKVDSLFITKIEKHKLDATVFTEFKPGSSWETYNSLDGAKVKVGYIYADGQWKIHFPDIVTKGIEQETLENERKARADKWTPFIKFLSFNVESKITEEGPKLVFTGEYENTGKEAVDMIMLKVQFFDPDEKEVYSVLLVPQYLSKRNADRKPFGPGEKRPFTETILSEIPDNWSGKINYFIWDAGPMPAAQ